MTTLLVESGLRSLMMAVIVWGGIKLLGVRHVLAQKIAWGLVLLTAFAMPLLMHWQAAHPGAALVVPVKQTPVVTAIEKRVSSLNITPSPSRSGIASTPTASVPTPLTSTSLTSIDEAIPTISLQPATRSSATWHASDLVRYIVPSYLAVSAVLLIRLLFGLALAMRIWNRAEPASPILEPRATVRISDRIQSPVTIGSGIVLPENYTEWDRSKLRFVLAHERSHVCQGDFYLQLLASLYAALVWISPLGWYLKHRLAELGEAISDHAALQEANDHSSYAEVLLEFAAMPRHGFAGVTAGVGMARSSNIQRRIERILNERIFRSAFLSGRRHAVIAALLVPCGLVLATSLLHVQAAEAVKAKAVAVLTTEIKVGVGMDNGQEAKPSTLLPPAAIAPLNTKPEPAVLAAIAENSNSAHVVLAEDAEPAAPGANDAPDVEDAQNQSAQIQGWSDSGDDNSFAVVDGDKNSTTSVHRHTYFIGSSDDYGELDRVRTKVHGSFLWFEHDGKSYVVTDPALVAKIKALYAPQEELGRRQAELGKQQGELGRQQGLLGAQQEMVKVPVPDISKEIAELQRSIQSISSQATQESLSELQSKLGEMQSKLGEAQSQAGAKMGVFGEQQGELGRKQGELGRQQGELGREQARIAREASRQAQSIIDQALRDGKAKPVE
ncbi:beta-lactamase regulating signal transducer with metallopeptidase domain [Silvibacterium bohemicum]|uniref:Beta-lactamase regulating signal transducer with metallopeptidase domain n=1 Tax=Silvibacterium bohemicum TaxID=1577686 RepID=A0A841K6T7_9BACT|nr:M56 family metallopeptidase [Silvibacterium bohemicum]MBB6146298.1 beta-lactamase regulating signal transducer with metallopeptidase domain [Silvibacterium bohemicum]